MLHFFVICVGINTKGIDTLLPAHFLDQTKYSVTYALTTSVFHKRHSMNNNIFSSVLPFTIQMTIGRFTSVINTKIAQYFILVSNKKALFSLNILSNTIVIGVS